MLQYKLLIDIVTYVNDASSHRSSTATAKGSLAYLNPTNPLPVLLRATNGKSGDHRRDRVKISTIVEPEALEGFYTRYSEVCKAGMQGLKKRDRSGRKKAKAKKRKGGVDGEKKT